MIHTWGLPLGDHRIFFMKMEGNGGLLEDFFCLFGGHFKPKMEDNWRTIWKMMAHWRTWEDKSMPLNAIISFIYHQEIPNTRGLHQRGILLILSPFHLSPFQGERANKIWTKVELLANRQDRLITWNDWQTRLNHIIPLGCPTLKNQ